jgi:hypothetical protein
LVRQPAECGERNHAIRADHDQAPKPMSDTGKTTSATICTNAILQNQVTTIYSGLDAIPEKGHNPVLWRYELSR